MVRAIGEKIGDVVGMFVRMEDREEEKFGLFLGSVLKVRVMIDITKPLRRGMTVRLPGKVRPSHLNIDYIRLPSFCHFCGLLSWIWSLRETSKGCSKRDAFRHAIMCREKRCVVGREA